MDHLAKIAPGFVRAAIKAHPEEEAGGGAWARGMGGGPASFHSKVGYRLARMPVHSPGSPTPS